MKGVSVTAGSFNRLVLTRTVVPLAAAAAALLGMFRRHEVKVLEDERQKRKALREAIYDACGKRQKKTAHGACVPAPQALERGVHVTLYGRFPSKRGWYRARGRMRAAKAAARLMQAAV